MKEKITEDLLRSLESLVSSSKPQIWYFDPVERGFAACVGGKTTVFWVRRGAKKERSRLGEWKNRGGDLTIAQARKEAVARKAEIDDPKKVTPERARRLAKEGPTLRSAVADYVATLTVQGARPLTLQMLRREMHEDYLGDWMDSPLLVRTGLECAALHQKIGRECGYHIANRIFRQFRAIWNSYFATKTELDDPPRSPTHKVQWFSRKRTPGYVARRGKGLRDEAFVPWHAAVTALSSTVRRDYHLITLLLGLRRADSASLRWEHLNLTDRKSGDLPARSAFRPAPKGGALKSFYLPLSSEAVRILVARKAENEVLFGDDRGWVFPARAKKDDVDRAEHCYICADLKQPRHKKGEIVHLIDPMPKNWKKIGLVSPHRLRDTYAGVLRRLFNVDLPTIKQLLNHTVDESDVTEGYFDHSDIEAAREPQERVAQYLVARWHGTDENVATVK